MKKIKLKQYITFCGFRKLNKQQKLLITNVKVALKRRDNGQEIKVSSFEKHLDSIITDMFDGVDNVFEKINILENNNWETELTLLFSAITKTNLRDVVIVVDDENKLVEVINTKVKQPVDSIYKKMTVEIDGKQYCGVFKSTLEVIDSTYNQYEKIAVSFPEIYKLKKYVDSIL